MIGGIDAHKRIVLQPRRVDLHRWPDWAKANLQSTDAVVIEATTNAWAIYDQLAPLVGRAVVAHPAKVKLIAASRVKTDKIDVLSLAHLLRADLLPEVWVPPQHVRDLRALLSHRRRLVSLQTTAKNRLQSVLHRLNLRPPDGDVSHRSSATGGTELDLSPTERLRVDQDVATLDHVGAQIAAVDAELRRLSASELWAEQVPYLVQLPGIALLSAMTILGAIGDITRFPTCQKTGWLCRAGCRGARQRQDPSRQRHHQTRAARSALCADRGCTRSCAIASVLEARVCAAGASGLVSTRRLWR